MTTSDSSPTGPRGPGPGRRAGVLVALGVVLAGVGGAAVLVNSSREGGPEDEARSCGAAAGDLRFDTEFTGADGLPVPYSVSLPADYHTDCREYPVLFALHGRGESNATFLPEAERLRAAVEAGVLDDVVIVTPDSERSGRWEGRYDTAFTDELIPHVERTYRVRAGAAHRLLVGWSMGGHGAFRFGIEHPEEFAAVWAVDGAMSRDPASYLEFLDRVRSGEPRITSVGGNLNGDRVEQVLDLFAAEGVEFPYQRLPLDHEFRFFVDAERDAGWPTLTWMDAQLGRPV